MKRLTNLLPEVPLEVLPQFPPSLASWCSIFSISRHSIAVRIPRWYPRLTTRDLHQPLLCQTFFISKKSVMLCVAPACVSIAVILCEGMVWRENCSNSWLRVQSLGALYSVAELATRYKAGGYVLVSLGFAFTSRWFLSPLPGNI